MFGRLPDFSLLKVFGCLCFSTNLNVRDKFSARALKCMFLGYADTKKAYKLLDFESELVFYSRDVRFYENLFPFKLSRDKFHSMAKDSENFVKAFPFNEDVQFVVNDKNRVTSDGNGLDTCHQTATELVNSDAPCDTATSRGNAGGNTANELLFESVTESQPCISEIVPLRRSNRQIKLPAKLKDFDVSINCSKVKYPCACWSCMSNVNKHVEPSSVAEALQNPVWKQATDLEMKTLLDNETWTLSELPSGRKLVGCKWVFRIKYKSNGTVE